MMKHKAGVWYPASDPPEENVYNIVLNISGKAGNTTYHHGTLLDSLNGYEDGNFYPWGSRNDNITVHAWYMVPEYPGVYEDPFWKELKA